MITHSVQVVHEVVRARVQVLVASPWRPVAEGRGGGGGAPSRRTPRGAAPADVLTHVEPRLRERDERVELRAPPLVQLQTRTLSSEDTRR